MELTRIFVGAFIFAIALGLLVRELARRRAGEKPLGPAAEILLPTGTVVIGLFTIMFGLIPLWANIAFALIEGFFMYLIVQATLTQRGSAFISRLKGK